MSAQGRAGRSSAACVAMSAFPYHKTPLGVSLWVGPQQVHDAEDHIATKLPFMLGSFPISPPSEGDAACRNRAIVGRAATIAEISWSTSCRLANIIAFAARRGRVRPPSRSNPAMPVKPHICSQKRWQSRDGRAMPESRGYSRSVTACSETPRGRISAGR